jgi:hypothetical protein
MPTCAVSPLESRIILTAAIHDDFEICSKKTTTYEGYHPCIMIWSKRPCPSSRQVCQLPCPPGPSLLHLRQIRSSTSSRRKIFLLFFVLVAKNEFPIPCGEVLYQIYSRHFAFFFLEFDPRNHLEVEMGSHRSGKHGNHVVIKVVILKLHRPE